MQATTRLGNESPIQAVLDSEIRSVDASQQTGERERETQVKPRAMPIGEAFRIFAEYEELQNRQKTGGLRAGEEGPKKPVVVLSKEHLESHASVQSFAQNVEVGIRYMYVIGPVIRTILATIEIIASLFASAVMALQACFITAENDSIEAKITAEFKRDEMLANAQYTLTYAFHGLANAVRAIFEATIIGHIVLNVSYDREYRVEYDLADRNLGDIYHTRLFSSNVHETTRKPSDLSTHGETRYLQEDFELKGVLASGNRGFNPEVLFDSYREAAVHAEKIARVKADATKAIGEHSKEIKSAEEIVREAIAFKTKHDKANKAIDDQIAKLTGEDEEALAKLEAQRPKLSEDEHQMLHLASRYLDRKKEEDEERVEGTYKRTFESFYGRKIYDFEAASSERSRM